MKPIQHLLTSLFRWKAYEKSDFLLQQKVNAVLTVCLSGMIIFPLVILYTVFFLGADSSGILIPVMVALCIDVLALYILFRGRFSVASHLMLISCLSAAWTVMFLDNSDLLAHLDTIAFVLAILSMTSMIVDKWRWPITIYFAANMGMLTLFVLFFLRRGLFPDADDAMEYWLDNMVAIFFIGIISYLVFSINQRALKKANRDLVERRHAEEAAETTRMFLERSLASIPNGVCLMDDNLRMVYINPVLLGWLGRTENDLLGKSFEDIGNLILSPRSRRLITVNNMDRIRKGAVFSGVEIELMDEPGTFRPVSLSAAAVRDKEGRIIGGVMTLVDLTELKQMETRLRQSQKMQAIGTLAGGIAHDFNNILAAIMGNTELLQHQNDIGEPVRKRLDTIHAASRRARDLVGQILLFSRKSEQESRPVALSSIVKETVKLLKASLPATIEIRQRITDESLQIKGDPTQIHQILMNLCTNAHHAMARDGGVLEIGLSALTIGADQVLRPGSPDLAPGEWVRVTVADTGHGMTPDMLERIFEPYFSTKEKGVGTGLGLAVVHGIVQGYGGLVEVDSKPGEGTCFSVYLPRLERFMEDAEEEPADLPMGNKERVLFVDDEAMVLDFGAAALQSLGYRVVPVSRPEAALRMLKETPDGFDLVITDMTMPKMKGDILAQEILSIRPDIPVILCTGFSQTMTREKALSLGVRELLMKPFDMKQLAETAHRLLSKSA